MKFVDLKKFKSPQEVKPKTKRKKSSKWRHDPSILIKGSVNYTTLVSVQPFAS